MTTRKPSRARVIAATKGALHGAQTLPIRVFKKKFFEASESQAKRQRELKARLKRARTATVRPKGRLPNPTEAERAEISRLKIRLVKAKQVLMIHKKTYGSKREFYADQLAYIKALEDSIKDLSSRRNPSMFGPDAVKRARRVQTISKPGSRRVMQRDTQERGEIIGIQPGGWVKVKWANRAKPTLIKRSEIRRHHLKINPGLLDLAGNVQALEYLASKGQALTTGRRRKRNASTSTSSDVRSPTRTSTSTKARTTGNITVTGGAGRGATTSVTIRRNPAMDAFTKKHLAEWLKNTLPTSERVRAGKLIRAYVKEYPGLIDERKPSENRSWREILNMAERERSNPTSDQERIRNLRLLLAGKKVDGLKMGDAGLSESWIRQHLASLEALEHARRTRIKARRNPSVSEMSKRFQGRATGDVQEFYVSDSAPRLDFSRAGKLVFLKLAGTTVRAPGAVVAIDPKTGKLWIANSIKRGLFTRKAEKGQLLDYGVVDTICYLTAKSHIGNGKTFEYVHQFGEEGGSKPRLLIDHDGMPILRGGSYKIDKRGIIN